jgi:tetratricopeptide (TPR) repeat protein
MGLKQLSSPPVSAAALVSWFLGRQGSSGGAVGFHNPETPLATVELLLSPTQRYTGTGVAQVPVAAATHANIVQSFNLWKDRVVAHASNVAVFYFCGHGVMGANDYLMPSDFGALNPNNPWADAIDISNTARAMRRLSSGPLYFFIDACRQASRDALLPGAGPSALAVVNFALPVRAFARLILWATGEGELAFGITADKSRFCAALIEALSGFAAEPEGKAWRVTGGMLAQSVHQILARENTSLEPGKRQYAEHQLIGSQVFHFETRPPRVTTIGIPWTVEPKVRQLLTAWGVANALPGHALEALAEQLEARDLPVQAMKREVKDWTQHYHELKKHLEVEPDSELAQHAHALLDAGKLQEAGICYEALIKLAEARRDAETARIASYNLDRGLIFRLDFRPLQALPYYKRAYQLCPDDPKYALHYAGLLQEQREYRSAEPILITALGRLRELAISVPDEYRDQLAGALNTLGILYAEKHRYAEARQAFEEALAIRRAFARANPAAFRLEVAEIFNNLGALHANEHRYAEARQAFEEALAIDRELAQADPAAYRPELAGVLNNLGNLHAEERRYAEADQAFKEALAIDRELAQANPAAYRPELAGVLNNLGIWRAEEHRQDGQYVEAHQAFEEALAINRELAEANPAAYQPDVATTLSNLGTLYADEHRYAAARQALEEALAIRRRLAHADPAAYRPNLAMTLNNLGKLHAEEHRDAEARQCYEEARQIDEELSALSTRDMTA